jgi:hypothetical protein
MNNKKIEFEFWIGSHLITLDFEDLGRVARNQWKPVIATDVDPAAAELGPRADVSPYPFFYRELSVEGDYETLENFILRAPKDVAVTFRSGDVLDFRKANLQVL